MLRPPQSQNRHTEQLIASMDAGGIDRGGSDRLCLCRPLRCAASNDYIIEAVQQYPDRLIGLAAVQPGAGEAAVYEAERCLNAGLRGVGELLPDGQNFDITDKALLQDMAALVTNRAGVMLVHSSEPVGHQYGGKGHTVPAKILALATNFPDLKIIAAHWGGGLPFYELMPKYGRP